MDAKPSEGLRGARPASRRKDLVRRFRRTIRRLLLVDKYAGALGHTIDFTRFSFEDLRVVEETFNSKTKFLDFSTLDHRHPEYVDALVQMLSPLSFISPEQTKAIKKGTQIYQEQMKQKTK